jgi:hypothetical protein
MTEPPALIAAASGIDARINSLVIVRGAFAEGHPEIFQQILAAIDTAKQFIGESPQEAKQLVREAINIDPEVIDLAWPRHDFSATLSDEVLADMGLEKLCPTGRDDFRHGGDRNTWQVHRHCHLSFWALPDPLGRGIQVTSNLAIESSQSGSVSGARAET